MCRKRNDPLCSEFCDIAEENSSASSEPAPSALPDTSGHFNEDNNAIMSIHAVKQADADHHSIHQHHHVIAVIYSDRYLGTPGSECS